MTHSVMRVPMPLPHQVFINFRGEEIRHGFLSHLVAAFELHGIVLFIDKDERKGKDLTHLFRRIEKSQIALAIFSGRYAQSRWCLNELVKMKQLAENNCLKLIPIFYKVKVDDVRHQKGEFGEYFWELAKNSSGEEIKTWKEALEFVSYKMGLTLGDNSSEADFVKEIIAELERVRKKIPIEERKDHTLDLDLGLSSEKTGQVLSGFYEPANSIEKDHQTNAKNLEVDNWLKWTTLVSLFIISLNNEVKP